MLIMEMRVILCWKIPTICEGSKVARWRVYSAAVLISIISGWLRGKNNADYVRFPLLSCELACIHITQDSFSHGIAQSG